MALACGVCGNVWGDVGNFLEVGVLNNEVLATCGNCKRVFGLGCVIPCNIGVFIAALKAVMCPNCGEMKKIYLKPEAI